MQKITNRKLPVTRSREAVSRGRSMVAWDNEPDRRWLLYLGESYDTDNMSAGMVVDLRASAAAGCPHYHDYMGWRRLLEQHRVQRLHCYQPTGRSVALLAAAGRANCDITIHLTGHIGESPARCLKIAQRYVNTFCCAGEFIAEQLARIGISQRRIVVDIPTNHFITSQIAVVDADNTVPAGHKMIFGVETKGSENGQGSPVILALHYPHNTSALKPVIYAASLLRQVVKGISVAVVGACDPPDKKRLRNLERMLDIEGLIRFEDDCRWDELVRACDLVVAGSAPLLEVLRLLQVRTQAGAIVAEKGDCSEFLAGCTWVRQAEKAKARQLATAMLAELDANGKQADRKIP